MPCTVRIKKMSYYPLATGEAFPGTRNNVSESALLLLLCLYYGYSSISQHSALVALPSRTQAAHYPSLWVCKATGNTRDGLVQQPCVPPVLLSEFSTSATTLRAKGTQCHPAGSCDYRHSQDRKWGPGKQLSSFWHPSRWNIAELPHSR